MSLPPLTHDQLVKPRHFELRLRLLFTAIFLSLGVHVPYFPLWLAFDGFSAPEIAVILSAPMFLRVVTTPIILTLADRAGDRATVLISLCAATLVASGGYFLPASYGWVLVVSLVLTIPWSPLSPLADSLALSGVRRFGCDYSRMRIFGSMSYLAANFFGGLILAASSEAVIPLLLSLFLAAAFCASLLAPRLGRPRYASPLSAADLPEAAQALFRPYFLLFLGSAGLTMGSHAFLFTFGSIYWKSLGLSDWMVGLLWSVAVVAEVAIFMVFTRLFGPVPATRTLIIAAVSAMARWFLFPLIWPSGLGAAGFMANQALHGLSTGLILLSLQKMIAETVAEERIGAAQGLTFFAVNFSLAALTLLSGPLYETIGVYGFEIMAGFALLALVLALLAQHSAPKRRLRR